MKKLLVVLLICGAFGGGLWYGRRGTTAGPKTGGRKILYWHDPMHPAYKSDKPGIAPDCGMKLEPVYADEGPAAAADKSAPVLYYRDPDDPNYRSDKPGLNPETGNELVPVHAGQTPGSIQVSAERQQLIGVRYGTAEFITASEPIRAVGKVDLDERLISHIHSRTEGWIDDVYADFTGRYVKAGEPLLTLYSPELVASQQEYLLAIRARGLLNGSTVKGVTTDSSYMVDAARRRLQHWELSESQIAELERTGKVKQNITLYAHHSGYITDRKAFPHMKIGPDTDLYTIADLSHVWIIADVYESDASQVRIGQPATVSLSYEPGKKFRGLVTYILPGVDPQTRTLKVRIEVANSRLLLKPEMFVDVNFDVRSAPSLVVPSEAVLDSGARKVVFVPQGQGFFEPREVEIGRRFEDSVEIVRGLKAGERIVVSGNFLLNSESQLKTASEQPHHD